MTKRRWTVVLLAGAVLGAAACGSSSKRAVAGHVDVAHDVDDGEFAEVDDAIDEACLFPEVGPPDVSIPESGPEDGQDAEPDVATDPQPEVQDDDLDAAAEPGAEAWDETLAEGAVEPGLETVDDAGPEGPHDLGLDLPDGCPNPPPLGTAVPLHVLFLGNSYTYVNDLPGTFAAVAAAAGRLVSVSSIAQGSWTLGAPPNDFVDDATTTSTLASGGWDVVILQEQSQIPSIPDYIVSSTLPAAKTLDARAHAGSPCERTMMFETWGRRDGGQQCMGECSAPFADFDAMQDVLTASYQQVATALGAEVAPVGEAWRIVRHANPEIELFNGDGSHPTPAGTYLAACVFYGRIFGNSPVGIAPPGGIAEPEVLQAAADAALWPIIAATAPGVSP